MGGVSTCYAYVFDIPWVGGQNTMDKGVKMLCVGGRNTMCRGFDIPWVGGSKYIKYIEPLIHGIFNPYPWYIDPPTHGILTPLPMVCPTLSMVY